MGNQASSDVYSRSAVSRDDPLHITQPDRWDYTRFGNTYGVLFHWCPRTSKFRFLQNVPSDTKLTILCHFVDMTYVTKYDDATLSQMLSNPDKNRVPAWFWKEYKKSALCESDGSEPCNEETSKKRKQCDADSADSVEAKKQKVELHPGVRLTRAHCFEFSRSEQRFGSYHLMVPDLVRIEHSCDANCMLPTIQPDLNHAVFRMTTIQDVRAGDELTIDFLQFYKTVKSHGLSVEAVFGDERSALLQKHGCASCKLQNCPLCSTGEWGHTT